MRACIDGNGAENGCFGSRPVAKKTPISGPLTLGAQALAPGQLVRRRAIHDAYGGIPRGGIAPLARFAAVLAFTGLSGEAHGYQDAWLPDGALRYYGEGQVGDMRLEAGNRAIDQHLERGDRLFLFDMNSGKPRFVRFLGQFRKLRRGEDRGPDRKGNGRRRFYFDREPIDATADAAPGIDTQDVFDEGREREIRTNRVERRREAVAAAKRIHGLSCQVCDFNFGDEYGAHGAGFIEVHHLLPVA